MQRNTKQRTIILDALKKLANHPCADEVYDEVHIAHPNISKATVYRVLTTEASEGVVRALDVAPARHYDHNVFEHWHIRCMVCGKIADVPKTCDLRTGGLPRDWEVNGCSVIFNGVCDECKKNRFVINIPRRSK